MSKVRFHDVIYACAILLIPFIATNARASAGDLVAQCASALKEDVVSHNSNYTLRYAYLNILLSNKASFDQASKDGSLKLLIEDVPIGFDYSESSVRKYVEQIKNTTHVSYDVTQSEAYVSSTLSKAGAAAFVACVKIAIGEGGVILSLRDTDQKVANVEIEWTGLTGISNVRLKVAITGGTYLKGTDPNDNKHNKIEGKGSVGTTIVRDPNQPLSIQVNVVKLDGSPLKTDSIIIPKYSRWINRPVFSTRNSPSSGQTCGWVDGQPRNGATVEVRVMGDDERILPDTARFIMERQSGPLGPARTSYGSGYYDWNEKTGTVVSAHVICNPADAAVEAVTAGHINASVEKRNLIDEGVVANLVAANPKIAEFDKNRIVRLLPKTP